MTLRDNLHRHQSIQWGLMSYHPGINHSTQDRIIGVYNNLTCNDRSVSAAKRTQTMAAKCSHWITQPPDPLTVGVKGSIFHPRGLETFLFHRVQYCPQSRCSVTKPDFKYNSNDWLFVLCTYKVRLVLPCRFAFTHACIACLQRSVTNTDENIAATETIFQRGENLNEGLVKACKSLLVTHMPSLYFGIWWLW